MPTTLHQTYQLKITLKHIRPPIWRRVLVPSTIKLPDLHAALQIAMGWTDSHLHQFILGRCCYGVPDPEFPSSTRSEREVRLNALLADEEDRLDYEYDFGDGWTHEIRLEKILPFDPRQRLPVCLKGSRACPPEDCGGPPGYLELLRLAADALDADAAVFEWLPLDFDPDYFDIDAINAALRNDWPAGGAR